MGLKTEAKLKQQQQQTTGKTKTMKHFRKMSMKI